MEFWRTAPNPWGQDIMLGIAWWLMWAAIIAGVVFLIGHAIWIKRIPASDSPPPVDAPNVPDKMIRHSRGARYFHWAMSITMFVLLITAFFPVVGIQFNWVPLHWIAGVALLATVIYHVIHSVFWEDFWSMWVNKDDVAEGKASMAMVFGKKSKHVDKPGKYPVDHKMYHHVIVLVSGVAIVTGLLMMVRIDTPFWERNPYLLGDTAWGWVYVLHGVSGVALITLVMAHVYFALRPEKWWMTMAMINGWVGKKDYLSNHDPAKWKPKAAKGASPPTIGGAGIPEAAPQKDQSAS